MLFMNPLPLKLSDVLHSTPYPVRCLNAESSSNRLLLVSGVTVWIRAVPFTCVTAGSAPVVARYVYSINGLSQSHPNHFLASSRRQTGAIGRDCSRCLISLRRT